MKRRAHQPTASSEKLGLRFEPDVLVRDRYSDACRPNLYLQPEKMLMLSVLEDAIYCFQRFYRPANARERKLFLEAEEWIWDDRLDWPYSFVNVCQILGFDADYLRNGLLRWKEQFRPASSHKTAQRFIGSRPYRSSR